MSPDPRLGSVVAGRYRLVRLLGAGQMARVYAADHLTSSGNVTSCCQVAVKVLHDDLVADPTAPARFAREVEAMNRLRSPYTVVFYDFGRTESGSLFIAMELLDGETLRVRLERDLVLPPQRVLSIIEPICACLTVAHGLGVLHRDVKPENVFLCRPVSSDAAPLVKLLDFGLAKLVEPSPLLRRPALTAPQVTVGTPAYLAPECAIAGRAVDARADIYSLAVMVYELMVGERPFAGQNPFQMMQAHASQLPPPPSSRRPDLSPAVDAFLLAALAKSPADRPQTAAAFAAGLTAALLGRLA